MDNEAVIEKLKTVLATAHSLALKAQNYHWNVTGPNFGEYHDFFGEYYNTLSPFIDVYAEHIRQLGQFAPGSLQRFTELTRVNDEITIPGPLAMMGRLAKDNTVMLTLLKSLHSAAGEIGDIGLVNTLDDTISFHSKMQWMLDSYTA